MNTKALFRCALLLAVALVQPVLAQDIKGTAAKGEKLAVQCVGCHGIKGYHASFPEIYHVPMLFGQGEKYLVSALSAYKRGERKHPTMRGVAGVLNEQDMADLAAYYATTQTPTHVASASGRSPEHADAAMELVKKGGCQSCHGENLSKPIDPAYPKIAGQYADYIAVALRAYKTEGNNVVGRGNAVMGGIAKQFSNQEIKMLSDYVASLPGDLETIPQKAFK
jgi:cytochrome c553